MSHSFEFSRLTLLVSHFYQARKALVGVLYGSRPYSHFNVSRKNCCSAGVCRQENYTVFLVYVRGVRILLVFLESCEACATCPFQDSLSGRLHHRAGRWMPSSAMGSSTSHVREVPWAEDLQRSLFRCSSHCQTSRMILTAQLR